MKKMLAVVGMVLGIAACTPTEQGATIGGATGAAIGGLASNSVGGAIIGGAAGAVAGALIGRASESGYCRYRDRYGRTYTARCPAGY